MSRFTWHSIWTEGTRSEHWSHSGIAVLEGGRVVFGAPEGQDLIVADIDGPGSTRHSTPLREIHGISLDRTSGGLLLADPGVKPDPHQDYAASFAPGQAIRLDLESGAVTHFLQPEHEAYREADWRPTSVISDSRGDVWVADGYGQSLVHRFHADGRYVDSLDPVIDGTALACPHGLALNTIGDDPTLLIADRTNCRILELSLSAQLLRVFFDPLFRAPSSLALRGDSIVVVELHGALLEVRADGTVGELVPFEREDPPTEPWPNGSIEGALVRPDLEEDKLNSPHGLAVDDAGDIFLTEWMIGGRQVRLRESQG